MTLWKVLMTGLQTREGNPYSVICYIKILWSHLSRIKKINDIFQTGWTGFQTREGNPLFCIMLYKKNYDLIWGESIVKMIHIIKNFPLFLFKIDIYLIFVVANLNSKRIKLHQNPKLLSFNQSDELSGLQF